MSCSDLTQIWGTMIIVLEMSLRSTCLSERFQVEVAALDHKNTQMDITIFRLKWIFFRNSYSENKSITITPGVNYHFYCDNFSQCHVWITSLYHKAQGWWDRDWKIYVSLFKAHSMVLQHTYWLDIFIPSFLTRHVQWSIHKTLVWHKTAHFIKGHG